ncbi:hypothetical protein [Phenylobacterium sp.]|uniref:hypothetical protein n=1 Tax=Phenylobacterium sp. TaxID=1871053 RepID=UPI0012109184|nr:hypothetical protein [Phenylobacterium sp.]THD51712.1 MAG: hypothetical protein E8A12_20645 [Phenylobacterium sp.]
MDIHKPKPWHSFREFLKEYGIIVLGVLTAIAFEQTVETIQRQARGAVTALKGGERTLQKIQAAERQFDGIP